MQRVIRTVAAVAVVLAMAGAAALYAVYVWIDEDPADLLRYAERRVLGHPKLETVLFPVIHWARDRLEPPKLSVVGKPECPRAIKPKEAAAPSFNLARDIGTARISGRVIRVGPQREITAVSEAARQAKSGDVVEIDAGEYFDDVAVWTQDQLTIRSAGGYARMVSLGKTAEAKAIWVIRGKDISIQGIGFSGARVPDRNGAGIRHEGGHLTVRDSFFVTNEMGLLTGNKETMQLTIIGSEFCGNATAESLKKTDPGHQIYVGAIGRFELRDSYFHHGAFGHLVKSRARENYVINNRLTDEAGGRSSYELEFPNGGVSYVVGNIIQQSSWTDNAKMISYGAEGYKWPRNALYVINNTLDDRHPRTGKFLFVQPGEPVDLKVFNNLLLGSGDLESAGPGEYAENHTVGWADLAFAAREDYRLRVTSPVVGKATDTSRANDLPLGLKREYVHPLRSRPLGEVPLQPGALQELAR